jgi:hypothetical protein
VSETTQLTVVERAALALKTAEHEAKLLALAKKYVDIREIANQAAREQVHSAYMELKNTRVAIQKAAKDAREDANQFSKAVIAEAERLTAITTAEELRLQALRDMWDEDREREKQAKAEAERVRVNAIRIRIDEMRTIPSAMVGKTAEHIARCIEGVEKSPVELEVFAEFSGEAEMAKIATLDKLREMLVAQQAHEQEQARIAQERAELERLRAEAAERERVAAAERAEQARKEAAARAAEEARLKAEREAHEAELRKQRVAAEAKLQAEREAAEAALRAQREELARQQAEIDRQRAEQEKREREAREAAEAKARAEKLEADHAEALIENARIDAELAAAHERARREVEEFLTNGPGDMEIVDVLATHYDVGHTFVVDWLAKFDAASFLTPTEKAA